MIQNYPQKNLELPITFNQQENGGATKARNTGLKVTHVGFIA
jgi:hypothetical protein